MKKNSKNQPVYRLRDILDEKRWEDFVQDLENWFQDVVNGDFKIDIENLKIEYKRDRQDSLNTAITGPLEEKVKDKILPIIPSWISPDHLTVIGLIGVIIAAIGYFFGFLNRGWLFLVPLGLLVNWFGDSFDGSIARYRKRTRPNYGYYIDKIVDAVAIMVFALGIGLSGFVRLDIALLFACAYFTLMLHVDLVVYVQNKAKNSFGLFGPTEIRIIGVIVTILMYFLPIRYFEILNYQLTQYDIGVFILSSIMFLMLFYNIISKGIELHKEDTKDW